MDCKDERSEDGEKRRREKKSKRSGMKGSLCIPSLKGREASPVSLLGRLRELMFRLIMISAVSKGSAETRTSRSSDGAMRRRCHPDSHHSEAIADCIDFFKKSATSPAVKEETTDGGDGDDKAELPDKD